MSKITEGERVVLENLDFEIKLVRVRDEGPWQPAIFLKVPQPEEEIVEVVWALEVPDALYIATTLRSDAREVAKQQKKMAEFAAAEEAARTATSTIRTPVGCSICSRPVSVITDDGTRYCKRCAEDAGVRPHGKIGDSA